MTPSAILSEELTAEARKTRAMIVSVAERHFKRYGYGKTTIVEIARDCAMSHANVYRFFRNKAELADAVATLWLEKIVDVGKAALRRPGSARERLVGLAVELHRVKKRELLRTKNVYELLSLAESEGRPSIEAFQQHINAMYVEIIEDGRTRGEFHVADARAAALVVQTATVKFSHPLLVEQWQDHDLEPLLEEVMEIVAAGLASRRRSG